MDTIQEHIEKIQSYATLEVNWDSYGAEPISESPIKEAIEFLKKLERLGFLKYIYFISPGPADGVTIEVRSDKNYIEFDFYEDETPSCFCGIVKTDTGLDVELNDLEEKDFIKLFDVFK